MRLLPDFPLFNIHRWLASPPPKTMSRNHHDSEPDAKPKRIHAETNWEMEEFERDLALRFAARDLNLTLEGTHRTYGHDRSPTDLTMAQHDCQRNVTASAPGRSSTPRRDRSALKQAFKQRWLKSQASNATIQALSVPCSTAPRVSSADNASEYDASDEELDFDFSDTRPSTPSTPTPPPYPLAHYSSRMRDDDYLEEDTQEVDRDQPDDDMQLDRADLNHTPTLTSSQSSSPSPLNDPITPVSATSDQTGNRHSLTRLFRTSLRSTTTVPTTFLSTTTTTAGTENATMSSTTTSQSMLSLVSHFSSCTSSCGDSDDDRSSSSSDDENTAQFSIMRKFRDLSLTRRRGAQAQLSFLHSPTNENFSETVEYPNLPKSRPRRYSSPDAPPRALPIPPEMPPLPTHLLPYSSIPLPPIRHKRRSIISDTASRMKMKRKKKRLVIRGIDEGDLEAMEGLGRWASRLGEVRKLTRVEDGTIWIEFRSRKVADNVCRLHARVEINGVGHVIIDWAESRQTG